MCRIFGSFGLKKPSHQTLKCVSNGQYHGGPDDQKFITHSNWSLGNNRLAIQGLDGGAQPYVLDNKIFVVFNGEIYNHNELRKDLIQRGYHFNDCCDGSIIPALYQEFGIDFVRKLNGMFAIALVDQRDTAKFYLATDPTGIKSVYYHWNEGEKTLLFSSEIHSLLAFGNIDQQIRFAGIDDYLFGRTVWGEKTIYRDILTLPPATILQLQLNGAPKLSRYTPLLDNEADDAFINIKSSANYLNTLIEEEVSKMVCADVPVCVVTSGGLDSSYLTALASKYCQQLNSFNIWYEGESWPGDERHFAEAVAKQYNTKHHQVLISEQSLPTLIDKMLHHIGQPNTAPHCICTFALFEAIHQAGFKVALTGDGADEFFGGYKRFMTASTDPESTWLQTYLDKLSTVSKSQRASLYTPDFYAQLAKQDLQSNFTYEHLLTQDKKTDDRLSLLLDFDQKERFPYYILRRVDHLSMAHSVEARVPFCQPRISTYAHKMPSSFKVCQGHVKHILYQAAAGKLPSSVMQRPKQPFTLPITAMLKRGHILFELVSDTLNAQSFRNLNFFNPNAIKKLINQQLSSPSDHHAQPLWALAILGLWLNTTRRQFSADESTNIVNTSEVVNI